MHYKKCEDGCQAKRHCGWCQKPIETAWSFRYCSPLCKLYKKIDKLEFLKWKEKYESIGKTT